MTKPSEQIINRLKLIKENPSILFMPYKYSMFDCMETVYLAAKESGLRADIMVIPYMSYPDNLWHDERQYFRADGYFPVLFNEKAYADYDFIVIHYPYDGSNNVTMIHPAAWTDKLHDIVYIPYHGNIAGPEWSRFFTTPGARNCDYICLGSEDDVRWFLEKNPDYSGKVIKTDGCTKAECAKSHENDPIMGEFANLEHPVALVSGTLWTFTHNAEERMEKHRNAIEKAQKDGFSVIYRTHPLVRDAIAVMRPQSLQKYDDFLAEIAEKCLLDDSPFLHNALRVADRLISDPSSVLKTWQGTGKPYEVIE